MLNLRGAESALRAKFCARRFSSAANHELTTGGGTAAAQFHSPDIEKRFPGAGREIDSLTAGFIILA